MPTLSANIKWATNIDELRKELKSGNDQLVVLQASADRTVRSLGGEGLVRAAHNAAAAIQQLGGVSKLTSSEQDKINSLMERAITKYGALGQAAPSALKQIADQTKKVTGETSSLDDHLKQIQSHVQSFSGNKVAQEATQIAKAVEQIGGADKLTADEQKRVNAAVTEAIEKYKALGQSAPKTLTDLAAATKQQEPLLQNLSQSLRTAGQQATNVGSLLTKAVTLPLVALGGTATKAAIDFESSFAGIRKTVDGVVDSSGNLTAAGKQMQQAMRDLAKEIPVSVDALNNLGETAGALGIPRDKIVEFAKVMAELGVTTNLTADEAADAIARIQNIFGAAGQDTDRFAATLVALGNAGASTERDIVEMAKRIAGAGNTVGLTQAQVLGFASALSSVGVEAEAGGTAISRVFVTIASSVSAGGAKLEAFAKVAGMTADQFAKAFKQDAAGATTEFIAGLGRIQKAGGDLFGTLEGLGLSEIRVRDALLRAAGAGDLLRSQLQLASDAWKENTALTKEAEQRFKTTASQLQLLWNRIRDVGITLGNALLPSIQAAVKAADAFLPILESVANAFAELPAPIQLTVVGLGAMAAGAGPALYAFGQLANSASYLLAAFQEGGVGARLLAGEIVTLDGVSKATAVSLRLLGQAALVAGAALAGWEIGKALNQLLDLDHAAERAAKHIEDVAAANAKANGAQTPRDILAAQVAELKKQLPEDGLFSRLFSDEDAAQLRVRFESLSAQLDVVNKAIKNGAAADISYADAIKYNEKAAKDQIEANKKLASIQQGLIPGIEGVTNATNAAGTATSHLAELNKTYAADLKNIGASGFSEIVTAHQKYGESVSDLAKKYGVAESSIDRYISQQHDAAEASKAAAKETKKAADEVEKAAKVIANANAQLNKQAQKTTDDWVKDMVAGSKASFDATSKATSDNLKVIEQTAGETERIVAKSTQATLEGQLAAIQKEAQARRDALDARGEYTQQALADIKEYERVASEQVTREWLDGGAKRKTELAAEADHAKQQFEYMRQSGLYTDQELSAAWEKMIDAQISASGNLKASYLGFIKELPGQLSDALGKMLTHAESFSDGFKSIWKSILGDIQSMLSSFLENYLRGWFARILGMASGSGGGITQGLTGSLLSGFGGGSGVPGIGNGGIGSNVAGFGSDVLLTSAQTSALNAAAPAGSQLALTGTGAAPSSGAGTAAFGGAAAIGGGVLGAGLLGGKLAGRGGAITGEVAAGIGGAALLGTGTLTASTIGGSLALGAATFGIGAGAVGAYMLIKHIMSTAGRDAVQAFVDQNFSGWDNFHKKLTDMRDSLKAAGYDSEQLWTLLSQGVSRGDAKEAQRAIQTVTDALNQAAEIQAKTDLGEAAADAISAWQELEKTGTATAEDLDAAWQKVHDAVVATGDVSLAQQFDEADKSVQKVKATIAELDDQIAGLQQAVDQEAPEAVMGTLEKKQRAQLELLKKQRADAQTQFDELAQHIGDSISKSIQDALKGPWNLQVNGHVAIETPEPVPGNVGGGGGRAGEGPEPEPTPTKYVSTGGLIAQVGNVLPFTTMPTQHFAAGGRVARVLDFTPRGPDRYPAMLAEGETVRTPTQEASLMDALHAAIGAIDAINQLPMAAGGAMPASGPIQLVSNTYLDRRLIARSIVEVLPGEARRKGVRVTS